MIINAISTGKNSLLLSFRRHRLSFIGSSVLPQLFFNPEPKIHRPFSRLFVIQSHDIRTELIPSIDLLTQITLKVKGFWLKE